MFVSAHHSSGDSATRDSSPSPHRRAGCVHEDEGRQFNAFLRLLKAECHAARRSDRAWLESISALSEKKIICFRSSAFKKQIIPQSFKRKRETLEFRLSFARDMIYALDSEECTEFGQLTMSIPEAF